MQKTTNLPLKIGDEISFKVPYFESDLEYKGKVLSKIGNWVQVEYRNLLGERKITDIESSSVIDVHKMKYKKGGVTKKEIIKNNIYDFDKKMALIHLSMVHDYAIKLEKLVSEKTKLEEWVKMKLTRIEQNIADVKHSLEGWSKFGEGGRIFKMQLNHIKDYAHQIIEMIKNGHKLMSWQESKLSVSADNIDSIYHYLAYELKMAKGGEVGGYDFKNVDITSEKGIQKAERLKSKGWSIISSSPFSITFQKEKRKDFGLEKKQSDLKKLKIELSKHGKFIDSKTFQIDALNKVASAKRFIQSMGVNFLQNSVNPKIFKLEA